MKKIKYILYDRHNKKNNIALKAKEFEYNDETLVLDFEREILNAFYKDKDTCTYKFKIINGFDEPLIDEETRSMYFDEFLRDYTSKETVIVVPIIPCWGTIARYKNINLVIHTDEEKHYHFPHIHVYSASEPKGVINIQTLELYHEVDDFSRKDKKVIVKYVEENRAFLLKLYNDFISGKEVKKVSITMLH